MRILYLLAAVFVCGLPLGDGTRSAATSGVVQAIAEFSAVPNVVSGIILDVRLYDTIGEVIVFSLAALGVKQLLSGERPAQRIRAMDDPPSIVLCQLGATVSALVAVELAVRGHLSPGGGFAAGVAGGTAIGLLVVSGSAEHTEALYARLHAETWEKLAVITFLVLALLSLEGLRLQPGSFGSLASGGWIPLLNVLVAIKVALGSWSMLQLFVRYRGLL
ncbi:Na(+)/H(+) antiporter subunit B [Synechococcus sp. BA-124 BA4]|uniref:Na(+)/H(+) antiporter subunit B n=1 Tax=unclassified Synechococcus TaxID=2626047 RepID=UPI0018CCC4F0|nr:MULTISPECIES: Na(+)/H(+) antiporter subunit B [unclassified Synechococcus]MEA5400128.1 Na(+)/H(+) antiporter subunit B [Synechococcus sp. BA-124 BA4]QPN55716.1 Na(+)/H(+) antiporter subunit B [Synechococcus sp. CBW1107]CAK6691403.1 hypothetical protein BBFGKLBO_01017 [Synechococcus sp. CBW1107]